MIVEKSLESAASFIASRELKATERREKVLAVLMSSDKPLSAYEVMDVYNQRYSANMVANSIYRILDWLVDGRFVHKLDSIKKYVACQDTSCTEQSCVSIFFICQKCQRVEESTAPISVIESLHDAARNIAFDKLSPHIELTGLCRNCK